jgi:hypothetical protein
VLFADLSFGVSAFAQSEDFGNPPSGKIPVIFNDRHVYTKPDAIDRGRVLAGIARGHEILVPLRSLLEELGGSVNYDPKTHTTLVRKANSEIVVRVGLAEIIVNGEARPLDVPPREIDGVVLVPLRVLAESLGAYVQYVPERHAVVVRTAVAPPVALERTPRAPFQAPDATPTPGPRAIVPPGPAIPTSPPGIDAYVVGAAELSPRVSNAFAPGVTGASGQSIDVRGDITNIGPLMIGGSYEQQAYTHPTGAVTVIGGNGQTAVPSFEARDREYEGHLGIGVTRGGYLDFSYLRRTTSYGYPTLEGFGAGLAAVPLRDRRIGLDAAVAFYPSLKGTCETGSCPTGPLAVSESLVRYRGGVAVTLTGPLFLDIGYEGNLVHAKAGIPIGASTSGGYAGLGLRL